MHAGNAPMYYRFGMCDASNALLSIVGVLIALFHRARTGEGQELWTSLHDGGVIFSSDTWLGPDGTPWDRPRLDKGLHGTSACYRLYETQDGAWIMVAATTDAQFGAMCTALGIPDVAADARFTDAASRHASSDALVAILEPAFRAKTARFWSRTFDEAGVPNEIPVDTFDGRSVLHDADNQRLGMVAEYEHPLFGLMKQFGQLINLSDTPGTIQGPPPLVGQHSREVLHGIGLNDGDVDALVGSGVVYEPDDGLAEYRTRFMN